MYFWVDGDNVCWPYIQIITNAVALVTDQTAMSRFATLCCTAHINIARSKCKLMRTKSVAPLVRAF